MSTIELRTGVIDLTREQIVRDDGQVLRLTSREASLLRFFAKNPRQPIAREVLLKEVWEYSENVVSRTIDTTIRRLRSKLEADPKNPVHLITVFGIGYRFEPLDIPETTSSDEGWLPAGCGRPGQMLSRLLEDARQLAEERGDGFVGLEHLMLVHPRTPPGGVVDATVRQICRSGLAIGHLSALSVAHDDRQPCWDGTPRLQQICATLPPRATIEQLWTAVLADPHRGIHALDRGRTLMGNALPANRIAPARRLEVIGGPEDGRCFSLRTSGPIGRWWPGRTLAFPLYQACVLEDALLSRSGNIEWQGDNTFFFRRTGTIFRWIQHDQQAGATRGGDQSGLTAIPIAPGEQFVARPWDLICPTAATTLQVLP